MDCTHKYAYSIRNSETRQIRKGFCARSAHIGFAAVREFLIPNYTSFLKCGAHDKDGSPRVKECLPRKLSRDRVRAIRIRRSSASLGANQFFNGETMRLRCKNTSIIAVEPPCTPANGPYLSLGNGFGPPATTWRIRGAMHRHLHRFASAKRVKWANLASYTSYDIMRYEPR